MESNLNVPPLGNEENADQAIQIPGADTRIKDNGYPLGNQAESEAWAVNSNDNGTGTVEFGNNPGVEATATLVEPEADSNIYTEEHPSSPGEILSPHYQNDRKTRKGPLAAIAVGTAGAALAGAVGLGWFLGKSNDSDKSAVNSKDKAVERTVSPSTTIPETTTTQPEESINDPELQEIDSPEPDYIKGSDPYDIIMQLDEADTNFAMTANQQFFTYTHDMGYQINQQDFERRYADALKNVQFLKEHPNEGYRVVDKTFNITIDKIDLEEGVLIYTANYERRQYHESLPDEGRVVSDSVSTETLMRDENGNWKKTAGRDLVDDTYSYHNE
ncbi:hypothetical protein DYH10_01155 [Candidatus Saccharibacteria bacterium CPR2]|nr:hypothetical protein [Candidatus Saccharibacteria bacterium CPR2]